jgi:hypothetical protein
MSSLDPVQLRESESKNGHCDTCTCGKAGSASSSGPAMARTVSVAGWRTSWLSCTMVFAHTKVIVLFASVSLLLNRYVYYTSVDIIWVSSGECLAVCVQLTVTVTDCDCDTVTVTATVLQ